MSTMPPTLDALCAECDQPIAWFHIANGSPLNGWIHTDLTADEPDHQAQPESQTLDRLPYKAIVGCFPSCPAQWGNFESMVNSRNRIIVQGGHIAGCPNTYPACDFCGEQGHFMDECPGHHPVAGSS